MRFESKGGPKRKNKLNKMCFVSWKAFFFCLGFYYYFSFALQR